MNYEKILLEDNKLTEDFEAEKSQETLNETCRLNYAYVLNENRKLFEFRPSYFANSLRKNIFAKKEIDTPDAALSAIQNAKKCAQKANYERYFNNIIKNGNTHLQSNDGDFCDKAKFLEEFSNEEFESNTDLAGKDAANIMVNEYLSAFTDDGWLISTVDDAGRHQLGI